MASTFTVHEASGYEQLMGRWSRKLAPAFVEFAGLTAGEKLLDVGCGTGSLTFELAARGEPSEILLAAHVGRGELRGVGPERLIGALNMHDLLRAGIV